MILFVDTSLWENCADPWDNFAGQRETSQAGQSLTQGLLLILLLPLYVRVVSLRG